MAATTDSGSGSGDAAFQHVADAAPFSVWMLDAAGRLAWVNKRYLELTGRTRAEARAAGRLASGFPPNVLRTDQEGTISVPM